MDNLCQYRRAISRAMYCHRKQYQGEGAKSDAQVLVFKDQASLANIFRSSTPEGTACEEGGTFRQMYDHELSHCIYEGEESLFRLALTQRAVLVDIEQKAIGSDREKMFEDEVEYYIQKLDPLLSMYELSAAETMKCVPTGGISWPKIQRL